MTDRTGMRGQPLLLLGAILAGWLALRVALWEPPFASPAEAFEPERPPTNIARAPISPAREQEAGSAPATPAPALARYTRLPERPVIAIAVDFAPPSPLSPAWAIPLPMQSDPPLAYAAPAEASPSDHLFIEREAPSQLAPMRLPQRQVPGTRWSGDAWLLLRRDSGQGGPALIDRPSYGRSQAGATVRYALSPGDPAQLRAHVRVASALAGLREREVAGGLSLRPLAGVPLRTVAELRLGESETGRHVRPALYAVSELPPTALPLALRGEVYVQGGYVGGEFATAYVDGQVRAEHTLARVGDTELSTGAGAWGGAQEGSSRMDVGPTAAITFPLGGARGRLSADYRFRIAGKAQPASGPTLTLSAGF